MTSKKSQLFICLATMLIGIQPIGVQSQTNQDHQPMEMNKIHATIEANNSAVAAGDLAGILATFEPTGVLMSQPGMPAAGSPALKEAFKYFMAMEPKISITSHDVIQSDDIALHSSTWKMSEKAPDGSAIEQTGFSVVVLRKQPDGSWLMVIDNPFGDHLVRKN